MNDFITAKQRLEQLTHETWSRQGSRFSAGPFNRTQSDSVSESLRDFDIEFDTVSTGRGTGFYVPTSEVGKLAAIQKSDVKSYLSA